MPAVRFHMYVRLVPFNLALTGLLGSTEPKDAERLTGMSYKTIENALGGARVGGEFIANSMAAFEMNREVLERLGLEISTDQFFERRASEARVLLEAVS